jgi:hypothetical protein
MLVIRTFPFDTVDLYKGVECHASSPLFDIVRVAGHKLRQKGGGPGIDNLLRRLRLK